MLHIHDKRGQTQAWGAKAIYKCLNENLKNVKIKYLENLKNETINGCDVIVVPNMGHNFPNQLQGNWEDRINIFAKEGGGVMLIHHSIGVGPVGGPPLPSVGSWSGNYYPVNDFKIVKKHPISKDFNIGDVFHDECWDYDEVNPGEDGVVIAVGLKKGIPTPALVAGKVGMGKVIVSGIGIGSGYKRDKGIKYEAIPTGGLKKILLNSVRWMLNDE